MSRIGIMSAMIEEIDNLLQIIENKETIELGQRKYHLGSIEGKDVVLVFSRWGKVAASSTLTTLINKFDISKLIFTGVAGSINNNVNIGDIVVADGLIQHDFDASPFLEKNVLPFINKKIIPTDFKISSQLKTESEKFLNEGLNSDIKKKFKIDKPKAICGYIASGDQFIKTDEQRNSIKLISDNILAVEMEGASIAQICYEYNLDFSVIRTISDSANSEAAVDFAKFIEEVASEYSLNIIRNFLKNLD